MAFEREPLAERFRAVRGTTERLCRPLAPDDYQIQAVVEVSPTKWHLAHVTWFFETFVLGAFASGYRPFDPRFTGLFNSYYETVGRFHPRATRHVLSRPTVEQVYLYRSHVDQALQALIPDVPEDRWDEFSTRLTLGLNHEQQHQELLLTDIKRNFSANPLFPAYAEAPPREAPAEAAPLRWIDGHGGMHEIGHAGSGFSFDNEKPRHRMFLEDYRLGSRLVINGEFLEFVREGGYEDARLWLSDGWHVAQEEKWKAPQYWELIEGQWSEMTLHGLRPLRLQEPVSHVSYYEADAFARWRGGRLPSEAELEVAVAGKAITGNFLEIGLLHARPAADANDGQWYGDLWEWTRTPYGPYPGFRPLDGALGEYNGKFMANQFVLRGGCCVTPRSHMRATYRNFYYPRDRWPFTGIRLAADAD